MAGERTRQSVPRRPGFKTSNGQPSNGVESDDAPAQEVVTLTPFSIDAFKVATCPESDLTQPVTKRYAIHIRPESIWASLSKYRNLDIRGETYSVHQYALISRTMRLPFPCKPSRFTDKIDCVARILEIRARDPQNVYARVYWVHRPEDIPGGRQPWHGENELIASNHMEIVDALTFVKRVDVVHWVEEDRIQAPAPAEGMYWRQEYNFLAGEVSPLPTHCVCHKPVNLHKLTVQCTNPRCMILLHAQCLIEYELLTLLESYESQQSQGLSRTALYPPPPPKDRKSKFNTTGIGEHYRIEIGDSQREHHIGQARFMFTDLWQPRNWETDIKCLKCGQRIERTSK
ncbi:MAG: hypothetical protein LQ343_004202 [Gyalolechia ehrenbergii]|nr:MAG: hypothetical protein LQ343_004202 [Gyalolechia ehrenbergii]